MQTLGIGFISLVQLTDDSWEIIAYENLIRVRCPACRHETRIVLYLDSIEFPRWTGAWETNLSVNNNREEKATDFAQGLSVGVE